MSRFVGGIAALTLALLLTTGCASSPQSTAATSAPRATPKSGWVILQFDIDPSGVPKNIRVLKSSDGGKFDSNAMAAVSKWKYEPTMVDGEAIWVKEQKVKVQFQLAPQDE